MNISNFFSVKSMISALVAILLTFSQIAFSQKKSLEKKNIVAPTFKYDYPLNNPVNYTQTSKIIQNMDINGQSMQTTVNSLTGLTIKSNGTTANDINLEVRIDTMAQTVDSPAGFTGGAIAEVAGKTFNITIATDGKVKDMSEAQKVTYSNGGEAVTDMTQVIYGYFPVLPSGKVTPGYTWTSSDSTNSKSPAVTMLGVVNSENKFEGMEQFKGVNCAKITSVITGSRVMKMKSQGMDITVSGPFTGDVVIYFAPEKGYFMKQVVTTKLKGNIDLSGQQNMSFPLEMDVTTVKETVK